mgnify:CR=1 FL=1
MSSDSASDWWSDGSVSIEFQDSNPKKHGSQAYERYESYKLARSVADATKRGATRDDLQNDYKKSFLKMTGKTPQGKIRRKGQSPLQQLDGMEEEAGDDEGDEDDGRHPNIKRELDFDADPRQDRLIAAIDKLTQKVDNLAFTSATKKDLQDFVHHTEQYVAEKLKPVTDEISELRQRIDKMETTGPARAAASSDITRAMERQVEHLMALAGQTDPNRNRVSFIGFPDALSASARTEAITKFMRDYPSHKYNTIDHEYRGKAGERTIKKVSYVEFASQDAAKKFSNEADATKFPIKDIMVKPALSKINRQRNYAIRKAEEIIKAKFPNKDVQFDRKDRTLSVDGAAVFKQVPNELGGTFSGIMAGSSLP